MGKVIHAELFFQPESLDLMKKRVFSFFQPKSLDLVKGLVFSLCHLTLVEKRHVALVEFFNISQVT
jgi:hypothetical protein